MEDMRVCHGIEHAIEPRPEITKDLHFTCHGMKYIGPDSYVYYTDREVEAFGDAGRMNFRQRGTILPFENSDACRATPLRHRLTRDRICSYIEALGIDPEATFGRRELDDPILFTSDPPGIPARYTPKQAERHRRLACRKERKVPALGQDLPARPASLCRA